MSYTMQTDIEIKEGVELICNIVYDVDPGEAMVMYYPDGSGHPGSPPSIELESVDVVGACFHGAGDWTHYDIESRGWKSTLVGLAERYVEKELEGAGSGLEEEMFEYANGVEEGAREAHYDSLREDY